MNELLGIFNKMEEKIKPSRHLKTEYNHPYKCWFFTCKKGWLFHRYCKTCNKRFYCCSEHTHIVCVKCLSLPPPVPVPAPFSL